MEQQVNQAINLGIGCVKAVSERYEEFAQRIKESVSDLVAQGEKSKDAISIRIRELAGKATGFLKRDEKTQKVARAA